MSAGDIYLLKPRELEKSVDGGLTSSTTESDDVNHNGLDAIRSRYPKRLRIRGDWSDTGPESRPSRESTGSVVDRLANVVYHLLLPASSASSSSSSMSSAEMNDATAGTAAITNVMDDMMKRVDTVNDTSSSSSSSDEGSVGDRTADEFDDIDSSDNNATSRLSLSSTELLLRRVVNRHQRRREQSFRRRKQQRGSVELLARLVKRNISEMSVQGQFSGHRNVRTVIKECAFWGDNHIMSGSDCGHVFVWNKHNRQVIAVYEADSRVVNCIQPHPHLNRVMFATSGIDHDVKIWNVGDQCTQDASKILRTISINHAMTDETQSTVTVPAPIIFRLLTTFSRSRIPIRSLHTTENNNNNNNDDGDDDDGDDDDSNVHD